MNNNNYVENLLRDVDRDISADISTLPGQNNGSRHDISGYFSEDMAEELIELAEMLDPDDRTSIQDMLRSDARFDISISGDGMYAYLDYVPAKYNGNEVTSPDIINSLQEMGIERFSEDNIQKILNDKEPVQGRVIAEGSAPVDGRDASIRFNFNRSSGMPLVKLDGSVDFKEFHDSNMVEAGALLCEIIPAGKGESGQTVRGETIPAVDGSPAIVKAGQNVRRDGNSFYAIKPGQTFFHDNHVHIRDVYVAGENVDMSTGNVRFSGNIYINKNVREGFSVDGTNNITVLGNVEPSKLTAGGDIFVDGGIIGRDKGSVSARGNIYALFVENGTISAGKNVYISKAVLNSRLRSLGGIYLLSGKGTLIGGSAVAREEILVRYLGSDRGTHTYVTLGKSFMVNETYEKLGKMIKQTKESIVRIKQALKRIKEPSEPGKRLVEAGHKLSAKLKELAEKKVKVMADFDINLKAELHCVETVYPGVRVEIGPARMYVQHSVSCVTFYYDTATGKIRMRPFYHSYLDKVKDKLKQERSNTHETYTSDRR